VAHEVRPIRIDAVISSEAKLRPPIVTDVPADGAPFTGASAVRTGASKENTEDNVPTSELRVTATIKAEPYPGCGSHCKEVIKFQVVVEQSLFPILLVAVASSAPKFKPVTVILVPVDVGLLLL
jgi:hypothetical protein